MPKEIYLSLEKQEDRKEMFSYALVYRGTDTPETACTLESQLDGEGYTLKYLNSDGSLRPLRSSRRLTREEATKVSLAILKDRAVELEHLLGAKLDLVDNS